MNKRKVEELIPKAYKFLKEVGIANDNDEISETFVGYLSSYGASIQTGSLIGTICYFEKNEGKEKEACRINRAIEKLIDKDELRKYVMDGKNISTKKEEITNALISLKLAANLYKKIEDKEKNDGKHRE